MREQDNSLVVSLLLHCIWVLYHYRYNLPEKWGLPEGRIKKEAVFIVMNGKTIFDEVK
jgi:hypothetical protein